MLSKLVLRHRVKLLKECANDSWIEAILIRMYEDGYKAGKEIKRREKHGK